MRNRSLPPDRGALALLTCVLTAACSGLYAQEWRLLETPRFTVYSQLSDRDTSDWASEFNQFIDALGEVLPLNQNLLPPLTVVIFRNERDFAPYQPLRPDGKVADNVSGLFVRAGPWSVIGMPNRFRNQDVQRVIYHEAVHWFMSADPTNYPAWFEEGIADLFSTFRIRGGRLRWGDAVENHVRLLQVEPLMPMEELLGVSRSDTLFNSDHRTGIFYAQSWAFVHYLWFGRHDYSTNVLFDYLRASQTEPPEAAFNQTFRQDYRRVQVGLSSYIRNGRYYYFENPQNEAAAIDAATVVARPIDAEAALARLAIGTNRLDTAVELVHGLKIGNPESPVGFELDALLGEREEDSGRVRAAALRAILLGSADATTHMVLARDMASDIRPDNLDTATTREIADLFGRAIDLNPLLESAYHGLVQILQFVDAPRQADWDRLDYGLQIFPGDGLIPMGLAIVAYKAQQPEVAMAMLERTFQLSASLTPEQLRVGRALQTAVRNALNAADPAR